MRGSFAIIYLMIGLGYAVSMPPVEKPVTASVVRTAFWPFGLGITLALHGELVEDTRRILKAVAKGGE